MLQTTSERPEKSRITLTTQIFSLLALLVCAFALGFLVDFQTTNERPEKPQITLITKIILC